MPGKFRRSQNNSRLRSWFAYYAKNVIAVIVGKYANGRLKSRPLAIEDLLFWRQELITYKRDAFAVRRPGRDIYGSLSAK